MEKEWMRRGGGRETRREHGSDLRSAIVRLLCFCGNLTSTSAACGCLSLRSKSPVRDEPIATQRSRCRAVVSPDVRRTRQRAEEWAELAAWAGC